MPRPTETRMGACVRSTACLASRKSSSGLVRICSGFRSTLTGFTGALPLACFVARSARNALAWNDAIHGGVACEDDVRGGAALKHLAHEDEFAVLVAVADAIADHSLAHRRGELGREIANLVGVRQQDQIGLRAFDHLAQRERVSVGRVFFEQVVLDEQHFVELCRRRVRRPARRRLCR